MTPTQNINIMWTIFTLHSYYKAAQKQLSYYLRFIKFITLIIKSQRMPVFTTIWFWATYVHILLLRLHLTVRSKTKHYSLLVFINKIKSNLQLIIHFHTSYQWSQRCIWRQCWAHDGQWVSSAQDSNCELWHREHLLSVVFLLASYSLSDTAYTDGSFCGFT